MTAMRLRSVIFMLLQLSWPFVAAARLIRNAGGEQGKVVRKGLLLSKVEPIGDKEESDPSPKGCTASVDVNVNASIHDGAKIL
jgi:hypothetical protein